MGGSEFFEVPKAIWGESMEFFRVPGFLYRERGFMKTHTSLRSFESKSLFFDSYRGEAWYFSKSQSLYKEREPTWGMNMES